MMSGISVAGVPIAGSAAAVRDYVTGADSLHYASLAAGTVAVNVTHRCGGELCGWGRAGS